MLTKIAGIIAGLLVTVAYIPYIVAIMKKETRPNRASWFIWLTSDIVVVASMVNERAWSALWLPLGFTIGALAVAVLSLKYGEKNWGRTETICSVLAAISIVLWVSVASSLPALLLNVGVLLFGAIPTIAKAWLNPSGENKWAWTLFASGALVSLIGSERWELTFLLFPSAAIAIDCTVATLVWLPRKKPATN